MKAGAELLAPAGNFATARTAFAAGADAVYCGLGDFSARAFADNFSAEELKDLLRLARSQGRKVYVTFNTVVDERDAERAIRALAQLDELRPDAVIVQDIGVARICRRHFPGLALHASTQLATHNLEGVLALRDLGFRRVVLARELSLAETESIVRRCGLEIEVFIHGALCYSISGLCLFGAMEKGRSGNRGTCPYCCRQDFAVRRSDGTAAAVHPFSMKDLRLGEDVRRLVDAGVASLKIEGRMKSALYVASVTRYYRQILDGAAGDVSAEDLETVFSRRTTELYFHGRPDGRSAATPVDTGSPGHVGAPIGTVKHVTKDRDGRSWLRFHTRRALEKHDGLQFDAVGSDGRRIGTGIDEMRQAISRRPVVEAPAGTDVEILISADASRLADVKPGSTVFCSMSNAVKRMFPTPSFRPGDFSGDVAVDLAVGLSDEGVSCRASRPFPVSVSLPLTLERARSPELTAESVRRAFSRLGGTDYRLGSLSVDDPLGLFAPPSVLNELRRALVGKLDEARAAELRSRVSAALGDACRPAVAAASERKPALRRLKIRSGQPLPSGTWDEVVVLMGEGGDRVATPVYTAEPDFARLRADVKRLVRRGCLKWEASDLATLRMLRSLGVEDITADWTLYAFNTQSLNALAELGVRRFVASPENSRENLLALSESGFDVEFLEQQSTPLFISLTEPAARPESLAVFRLGRLWVTTRPSPRTFKTPPGASTRVDISWNC